MSKEGTNLPQELEGSHDQAAAPHGSIPTSVGSATETVMAAGSNSSTDSKLAIAVNNSGSSERASPAALSAGEGSNDASKIAIPVVLQADEDSNAAPKIASPAVVVGVEENKADFKLASLAVLVADEEEGNNAAGSHDGMARSKPFIPAMLRASDRNNGGSKMANQAVPQAIVDNTTGSKLDSPAALHVDEEKNFGFTPPNVVFHASKDMDNNTGGRPKFASRVLLRAGRDNRDGTKLAIQAVSHAGGNTGSPRLTRSVTAALRATKDNASKVAIQVVRRPHAVKDNNAGSSKAARPAAVDAGESSTKEGKNIVAGDQRALEAHMGDDRGKGNATAVEDADPDLHIFTERERRKKMKNMFSILHALLPQLPDKADKAAIVGEAVTYIKTLESTAEKLEKLKLERKRALEAQQQVVIHSDSSHGTSACHRAPALPAPATVSSSSREANLADMVPGLQAQQVAVAKALAVAAAAAAGAGASSSSSSSGAGALPHGTVPFPAPAAGFQTWSGQNVVLSVANNEAYINLRSPPQPGMLTKALFVLERHNIEVITTTISTQDGFRIYGIHARANPALASARFPENLCAEDKFKLAVSEMVQLINI